MATLFGQFVGLPYYQMEWCGIYCTNMTPNGFRKDAS